MHRKMFEAKILQGSLLKKIIEAIRELVVDANLDCNERGITMQVCCTVMLKHDAYLYHSYLFNRQWILPTYLCALLY